MSLSSSRVGYKHRCTIQRDANAGTDDGWGGSESPDWQDHLVDLPCRGWSNAAKEPVDEEKTVTLVDRRVSVALGTDVTEADRVSTVIDREGNTVLEGPMGIEGILTFSDHMELILERIR